MHSNSSDELEKQIGKMYQVNSALWDTSYFYHDWINTSFFFVSKAT